MTAAATGTDRLSRAREIIAAARALFQPGATVEIRVPKAGREHTISGYSSDPQILAKLALAADRKAQGVYWTINLVNPALKARAEDKLKSNAEQTTADHDILIRCNLLLDVDAVRPSGISSTDEEHQAALDLAWVIRRELIAMGWPEPLVMDSGNGAYLIFRLPDLPNNDESLALVKAVLAAIGARFNTDRVKIDPATCNASRVAKIPGTTAMKGDSTSDRPHRLAQVLHIPELIQPVPLELLQSMAATATEESKARQSKSGAGARAGGKWIDTWLPTSGLEILDGPKTYQGGRRWHVRCPWNEDHDGTSAAILERPGGELAFRCLHESCSGYGWAELRQLKEPGHRERNGRAHSDIPDPPAVFSEAPMPKKPGRPRPSGKLLETIDALTIFRKNYPEPVFVIPGLLMRGVTFCCGRPKIGKSWLVLQLALAVARGTLALGKFSVESTGRVLYCGLEESPRRTGNRLKKFITAEEAFLQNIEMVYRLKPLFAGGAAELDAYLTRNPSELVIIDTYLAVVQANGKRDVLRSDYNEVKILTELAEKHQTAILVVHHLRKMGAEYALDAVAGTTGLTAGCDAIWALTRTPEGTCKLSVQGRDMANPEFELKFNDEHEIETKGLTGVHTVSFGWHILAEGNEIGMSQERKDILLVIEQEGRLKPSGIARLLGNKNVITVRRLLQKMVADDMVTKDSNGRYGFSFAYARAHKIPMNDVNEKGREESE